MSDDWLVIHPADPNHVPELAGRAAAVSLVRSMVDDCELTEDVTEGVAFLCDGQSLSSVRCPNCLVRIDEDWWARAMYASIAGRSTERHVPLPEWGTFAYDEGYHLHYFDFEDWLVQDGADSLLLRHDRRVQPPCCKREVLLEDLVYDSGTCGFATYRIEVMNPDSLGDLGWFSDEQMAEVEGVLGCELRQLRMHI